MTKDSKKKKESSKSSRKSVKGNRIEDINENSSTSKNIATVSTASIDINENKQNAVDDQKENDFDAIGNEIFVRFRDGSIRKAKIIEKSISSSSTSSTSSTELIYEYYVHYNDFNRRMDEWINSSRIIINPTENEINNMNLNSKNISPNGIN